MISGTSPDERLVEVIEIHDHPFFVASQYHPEFKSRPERPAPLFRDFVAPRWPRGGAPADHGLGGAARARAGRRAGRAGRRFQRVTRAACGPPARRRRPGSTRRSPSSAGSRARSATSGRRRRRDRALRAMGLEVTEDDAAGPAEAGAGNLLARIPGRGERTVLLCAHLDTVEQTAPIEPVLVDGGWENANDGILGADNKAALAVMLEVARRATIEGSPVGHRAAVHRRRGERPARRQALRRGAAALGLRLRVRPRDPDRRGGHRLAELLPRRGRVPRPRRARGDPAGGRPQRDPRAARAVAAMPLGRIDPETTANVGSIPAASAPPTSSPSARGCSPRPARSTPTRSRVTVRA